MLDQREDEFLLGIEMRREKGGVVPVQEKYAREVVTRFGMMNSKPASTPPEPRSKLSMKQSTVTPSEKEEMSNVPFRQVVGSLMYLARGTRPNLAESVSRVSRFCQNPGRAHWEGVKRILRHVVGTSNVGLLYLKGSQVEVWGYSDAGHGGSTEEGRGRQGHVFISGGDAISWRSSLLGTITDSSCEREYMGLSAAANEAIYLRQLQKELKIVTSDKATLIVGDNESCQKLAENPVFHRRSKHILAKYHSI